MATAIFGSYKAILDNHNDLLQKRVTDLEPLVNNSLTVTYIRWGSSSCSDSSGTMLVYSGYAGGTSYLNQGGGSNQLCMPMDPEYTLPSEQGIQGNSYVFGSEYESVLVGSVNKNVPCAVCLVSGRSQVIMVPAMTTCPDSWNREYYGYLMSEKVTNYRSMFICVDVEIEAIPNSSDHAEACDLWHVEASCASLPCPPYNEEKELGCAVCSR